MKEATVLVEFKISVEGESVTKKQIENAFLCEGGFELKENGVAIGDKDVPDSMVWIDSWEVKAIKEQEEQKGK